MAVEHRVVEGAMTGCDNPGACAGSFDSDIYITYPLNRVAMYQEYLVYDDTAIVASVGGGLGLFLGFSCLSSARSLVDFLFAAKGKVRAGK